MRKLSAALSLVLGAVCAFADHLPHEILIRWKAGPEASPWNAGGTVLTKHCGIDALGWQHWELPVSVSVEAVLGLVRAHPGVAEAEPNYLRHSLGRSPNDPLTISQKHLENINAYGGWEFETGSSSAATIAIIDTGVDISHVDLSSKAYAVGGSTKIWTNPAETAGNGLDDDGNSRTDDIHGWNFADNNGNVLDCIGHGTLVASVAGATADNGTGVAGVSWGAKILPLKVFPQATCDTASSFAIASAINYAVWAATASTHSSYTGRMVVNLSLGCQADSISCPASAAEQSAVQLALSHGIPVVAAKGNFGNSATVYPSDYPGVIGVGATSSKDLLASFSSHGSSTDIVAPGVDIFGAAMGGGYRDDDGTSFSSPQVAGAAALIFSMLPTATTAQVEQILYASADDLGASGRDDFFGHGRLNLFAAMRSARFGTAATFDGDTKAIAVPNPFRAAAGNRVTFSDPQGISGGPNPKSAVYDLSGMLIREVDGFSWDGKNTGGATVAPGVYFFEVRTDKGKSRGRVIVGGN